MLTSQPPKELRELLSELVDGQLDAHGLRRLEEILRTSPESQTFYDSFMTLHGMLLWGAGPPLSAVPSRTDLVSVADPQSQAGDFPPPPPSGLLGAAWHGATGYLSNHDFVLPYSISAVLIGIAMWVSSMIYVSHHVQVARVEPTPVRSDSHKEIVLIGRITGMVDVKWSDDPRYLPPPDFAHVPLDRKYILDSGLLEITYDSGAKVILQGPCTYEVESSAGGYLALGKLTAKVEAGGGKGSRSKVQGSRSKAEPSSFILHPSSLFSVRTPTAVVTDLGTEFGVDVKESGDSLTHVFMGRVEVRLAGDGKENVPAIQLAENESVQVDGNGWKRDIEAGSKTCKPESFVRRMPAAPKPSPIKVLAWFRLGDDDPGAVAGATVNKETIDHEGHGNLSRRGEPSYSAHAAPDGGDFSMRFHGTVGEGLDSHACYTVRDNFILEAWVKVNKLGVRPTLIAYNGHSDRDGFGLFMSGGKWKFIFGGIKIVDSGVSVELGKWTHVALVCQWGRAQLWVNGRPAGELFNRWRPYPPEGPFLIGYEQSQAQVQSAVDGEIDEVRLSALLRRFRPEMLLFPSAPTLPSPTGDVDEGHASERVRVEQRARSPPGKEKGDPSMK